MFYGTYAGFAHYEAFEFKTREELEIWLNYQEPFSLAFGASGAKRQELKNKNLIMGIGLTQQGTRYSNSP